MKKNLQKNILFIMLFTFVFTIVNVAPFNLFEANAAEKKQKSIKPSVKKTTVRINSKSVTSKAKTKAKAKSKSKITPKNKRKISKKAANNYKKVVATQSHLPEMSTIVVDEANGKVILSDTPDLIRHPASLTKMMTLYLTFDALKKGNLSLNQRLEVSEYAAQQPQTNISLSEGDSITVKDAILSLVVRSANDSSVVLAEAIGKSVSGFAQRMTNKALQLGMKNTVFRNASGLPDDDQITTARDMAILGIALRRDFPQYFPFFKIEAFTYNGKTYNTHNRVMLNYEGVDGIKTGYIRSSGFNLVSSVNRDGHRLVAVVMGGRTWRERDSKMMDLLDNSFTQLASNPASRRTGIPPSIKNRKITLTPKTLDSEEWLEGGESNR
jgi:D-alanyl-D-alanine carboxypeptidase